MSKEAMKLALHTLLSTYPTSADQYARERDAIIALREALAEQPAQQEPDREITRLSVCEDIQQLCIDGDLPFQFEDVADWVAKGELPITPPASKPLTDEQEREAFETHWYSFYHSGSVSARSDGSYVHPHVQRAWEAWQARAAQE